jgi:hypothetical protein
MKVGNIIKAQSEEVPLELNLAVGFGFHENPYDLGVKINARLNKISCLFLSLSLSLSIFYQIHDYYKIISFTFTQINLHKIILKIRFIFIILNKNNRLELF